MQNPFSVKRANEKRRAPGRIFECLRLIKFRKIKGILKSVSKKMEKILKERSETLAKQGRKCRGTLLMIENKHNLEDSFV